MGSMGLGKERRPAPEAYFHYYLHVAMASSERLEHHAKKKLLMLLY
jgi:hypothetical protein